MAGGHLLWSGVLAQELTESEATRRVLLVAGGLLLIGLVLLVATVWWWRATRPVHPVLAPLDIMSDRRWRRANPDERRRMVDESRRADSATAGASVAAPETVVARRDPQGFSRRPPMSERGSDDLSPAAQGHEPSPADVASAESSMSAESRESTPEPASPVESPPQRHANAAEREVEVAEVRVVELDVAEVEVVEVDDDERDAVADPLLQRTSAVAKD